MKKEVIVTLNAHKEGKELGYTSFTIDKKQTKQQAISKLLKAWEKLAKKL